MKDVLRKSMLRICGKMHLRLQSKADAHRADNLFWGAYSYQLLIAKAYLDVCVYAFNTLLPARSMW